MIIGTDRNEINELNRIDLIDYFISMDIDNIKVRKNGTVVHKSNEKIVIYNDHSYQFDKVQHPYRDAIGTLREIYNYDFMTAIERLRIYKNCVCKEPIIDKPSNNISVNTGVFMSIPDGIDEEMPFI